MWLPSNKTLVEWGVIALAIALIGMLIGETAISTIALIIMKFCWLIAFVRWVFPVATGAAARTENQTNPPQP